MKNIFLVSIFFLTFACTSNNQVFWCGDHPCINKKEKKEYFKKTMIVEIKEFKKKNHKENSEVQSIINKAKLDEKKRIKSEKYALKQTKINKKKALKEQKKLKKQLIKDEKKRLKAKKKQENKSKVVKSKKIDVVSKDKKINNIDITANTANKFSDLVKIIYEKNSLKDYPDINNIPK